MPLPETCRLRVWPKWAVWVAVSTCLLHITSVLFLANQMRWTFWIQAFHRQKKKEVLQLPVT